jgi:membrane-associated phospholipid phosphatase
MTANDNTEGRAVDTGASHGSRYTMRTRAGRTLALVLLACVTLCTTSQAQERFPYKLDPWLDGGLTAGGVALLAGAIAVYEGQDPLTPEEIAALDPADISGFDRSATEQWSTSAANVSDVLIWTMMAAPVGLAIATPGSRQSWTVAAMWGEALLLNNGFMQLLKGVTNRTRPYVYNDDPDIPDELRVEVGARRSFPSSHTANAFASAVFFSSVYAKLHPASSARTWVWVGSLTLAATTGYLRYQAGKHYPTDIIGGAIIGSLIGSGVPKLHQVAGVNVTVGPSEEGGTAIGVVLQY